MTNARKVILGLLVAAVVSVVALPQIALASAFGAGAYGSCGYETCPQSPPTTFTMPTGLQVAINLTNGQVIGLTGYRILVTPLNGQGSSFQSVAISVNGAPVYSGSPDDTGTVSWYWIPAATGSTQVSFVITGTNGTTTTEQFTITVRAQAAATAQPSAVPPATTTATALQSIASGVQHVVTAAVRVVKKLPAPVVHSFPYVLFLLLGVDAVLLLGQAERELHEYHALEALLIRARTVDEAKKTFAELATHYLRTPLTVIKSGVELLQIDSVVPVGQASIQAATEQMRRTIESLVAKSQAVGPAAALVSAGQTVRGSRKWLRQPGLYVPIALIIVVWLAFEYLVERADTFSVSQVELGVQIIVFTIVAVSLYVAFRYRQLRKRDVRQMQRIVDAEVAVGQARDSLVHDTVTALQDSLSQLDQLTATLQGSVGARSVQDGRRHLHDLLTKFSVVELLRGSHSDQPLTSAALSDLLAPALASLRDRLTERALAVSFAEAATVPAQEPDLLTFVLSSILDNAVAYSAKNSQVEVKTVSTTAGSTITITDQGQGIPTEKKALLFQPFSKVEGAEVFTHEGMGFSLYLDKLIMTYLGGSITLESEAGKGTTVALWLPSDVSPRQSAAQATDQSLFTRVRRTFAGAGRVPVGEA